jgi:hypothetical protein
MSSWRLWRWFLVLHSQAPHGWWPWYTGQRPSKLVRPCCIYLSLYSGTSIAHWRVHLFLHLSRIACVRDRAHALTGSRAIELNHAGSSRRGYIGCCSPFAMVCDAILARSSMALYMHIRRQIASRHARFTCFHFLLPPSSPPLLAWIHAPSPPSPLP